MELYDIFSSRKTTVSFMRENLSLKASKQGGVYVTILLIFLMAFGWAWMMQESGEGLSKLNTETLNEAAELSKNCYLRMNPRIGELCFFFLDFFGGYKMWMLLFHPISVIVAVLCMFKLVVGHWPWLDDSGLRASATLLSLFIGLHILVPSNWFLGNVNWFYPTIIAIAFFCLLENIFYGDFRLSGIQICLAIPMAVIVGMSNENTSVVSCACYILCGVYYSIKRKSLAITASYLTVAAVLLLAAGLFYLSPARVVRAESANWELTPLTVLKKSILVKENWIFLFICFWRYIAIGVLLLAGARYTCYPVWTKRVMACVVVGGMLFLVLFGAPLWGAPRSYIPIQLVVLMIIGRLVYVNLNLEKWLLRTFVLCGVVLVLLTSAIPEIYVRYKTYNNWNIIEQKASEINLSTGANAMYLNPSCFCISPLWGEQVKIPSFIMAGKARPFVPLISISKDKLPLMNGEHGRMVDPWKTDCYHDVARNKSQARRLGLEAVYYIVEPKKKD